MKGLIKKIVFMGLVLVATKGQQNCFAIIPAPPPVKIQDYSVKFNNDRTSTNIPGGLQFVVCAGPTTGFFAYLDFHGGTPKLTAHGPEVIDGAPPFDKMLVTGPPGGLPVTIADLSLNPIPVATSMTPQNGSFYYLYLRAESRFTATIGGIPNSQCVVTHTIDTGHP